MSFLTAMKNEMLETNNECMTENGAFGYSTTGKSLLDLHFAVASLRSESNATIVALFKQAFSENKTLAMKWLFFARDVREGLGERRLFRTALRFVAAHEPEMVRKLVPLIPEYGRYDDLWVLLDNEKLRPAVVEFVRAQLSHDVAGSKQNQPVSLLAKWMPSANASSAASKKNAKILCHALGMKERAYRQTLSALRQYLDVVEVKMSAKRWGEVNYETVPSKANVLYNYAFLRNDEARRRAFLDKLEKGKAKINSSVLYPHDLVHLYTKQIDWSWFDVKPYNAAVEGMWNALPDLVEGCANTIVVADGSGSMQSPVGDGSVLALDVANALAIYFSEHSSGEWKNQYITFSATPQLVNLSPAASLREKLQIILQHNEASNTNIEAVFDLILQTAVQNGMEQSEIPANVLIISDMEFDEAVCCNKRSRGGVNEKLFQTIEAKYRQWGYQLPRLVFWNVNSRTNAIPVRENALGVALVSGFSVHVCKMVMSGKTDPFECLLEQLNSERYQPVEEALKGA